MLRLGTGIHAILQGTHSHPCYILYSVSSKFERMECFVVELAALSIKVILLVCLFLRSLYLAWIRLVEQYY